MVCKLQLSCVHGLSACGQPCLNRSLNHYCNTESRPEVGVRGCFTLFPSFQKKPLLLDMLFLVIEVLSAGGINHSASA